MFGRYFVHQVQQRRSDMLSIVLVSFGMRDQAYAYERVLVAVACGLGY